MVLASDVMKGQDRTSFFNVVKCWISIGYITPGICYSVPGEDQNTVCVSEHACDTWLVKVACLIPAGYLHPPHVVGLL